MKIAINNGHDVGWSLSGEMIKELGFDPNSVSSYEISENIRRDDPKLIELVGKDISDNYCTPFAIVEIPDEATDWEVLDYDGLEHVIYVLDGSIYHAYAQ